MTIARSKFYVSKVSEMGYPGQGRSEIMSHVTSETGTEYKKTGVPFREITMSAVYDDGLAKENKSFSEATPSGTLTFTLSNVALADEFKPGEVYYMDFVKAE